MPSKAEKIYFEMLEYYTFLDTYLPKLSHYKGFTTANTILKKSLSGYEPDMKLTNTYKEWLSDYLDLNLE